MQSDTLNPRQQCCSSAPRVHSSDSLSAPQVSFVSDGKHCQPRFSASPSKSRKHSLPRDCLTTGGKPATAGNGASVKENSLDDWAKRRKLTVLSLFWQEKFFGNEQLISSIPVCAQKGLRLTTGHILQIPPNSGLKHPFDDP